MDIPDKLYEGAESSAAVVHPKPTINNLEGRKPVTCKQCAFVDQNNDECQAGYIQQWVMDEDFEFSCDGALPSRKECARCGSVVVHGARKYRLCLDCIVDLLVENDCIDILAKYRDREVPQ